jgi:glycosyltransferase involved in cell wall biosynthesis
VLEPQTPMRPDDGAELAERLCEALDEHGHEVELIRIPFREELGERVLEQMLAVRLVNLDNVERAVALRFPAYLLPHEGRVVWLQQRALARGGELGASVRAAERRYLAEAARVHATSALAARELARDTGLWAPVLYEPLREDGAYRCERYGERLLLLAGDGVTPSVAVALAALALAPAARMTLACPAAALEAVAALARELGTHERVELVELTERGPVELLAVARALVCVERDSELSAREAFRCGKAVIALADCGCAGELLRDGVNGRVAATVEELGQAYEELSQDLGLAERYGIAASSVPEASWESVVAELTR